MRNTGLDEAGTGIKIAGRNISDLRYAEDITLMAESEEEPKSLLMTVKEESEKGGLKYNIQKTKIMASSPITSWQIYGETMKTVRELCLFIYLFDSKITADGDCSHEIRKHLLLGRKAMTNLESILKSRDITLPSNHLILCHPLLLLPPIPPSIGVFSNELALHIRWQKYGSFSSSVLPMNIQD